MSIKTSNQHCRAWWGLYGLHRNVPPVGVSSSARPSSKALVRFLTKQMTSLIKWVYVLPCLLKLLLCLWGEVFSSQIEHSEPSVISAKIRPVCFESDSKDDCAGCAAHPASTSWVPGCPVPKCPASLLCLSTHLEIQEVHHHPLSTESFFSCENMLYLYFIHWICYYLNTLGSVLSTRDKAVTIIGQTMAPWAPFHLVSFFCNLVRMLRVCLHEELSLFCPMLPGTSPCWTWEQEPFLIPMFFSST